MLPEQTAEQLPKYAKALHRHGLQLPYITTAIANVSSPRTEEILRTAKKLGVTAYRIGFIEQAKDTPVEKQLAEVKAHLKELAALNREIGIGAVVQNHSPDGKVYLAGDLGQLEELVSGFDPEQIGVAFDIGHAIIVHGNEWRPYFERLQSHLVVAYVKDAKRAGRWVPFGQGEIAQTGYFELLKKLPRHIPLEMHIEYDWSHGGQAKTRPALLKVLKESAATLRQWMA